MYREGSAELFIEAYRQGIFPMAESRDDEFYNFYRPEMRGLLPITGLHIPKKLKKTLKKYPYQVTINTAFADVIDACAEIGKPGREVTWINNTIRDVFIDLHKKGRAHCIEAWQGKTLVGGLYGMAIGRVFCGESMFSKATDASKIALVHLTARLWKAGFTVLDTQFINDHLKQFGAYEMPQEEYETLIETEMRRRAEFTLKKHDTLSEQDLVLEYLDYCSTISSDETSSSACSKQSSTQTS